MPAPDPQLRPRPGQLRIRLARVAQGGGGDEQPLRRLARGCAMNGIVGSSQWRCRPTSSISRTRLGCLHTVGRIATIEAQEMDVVRPPSRRVRGLPRRRRPASRCHAPRPDRSRAGASACGTVASIRVAGRRIQLLGLVLQARGEPVRDSVASAAPPGDARQRAGEVAGGVTARPSGATDSRSHSALPAAPSSAHLGAGEDLACGCGMQERLGRDSRLPGSAPSSFGAANSGAGARRAASPSPPAGQGPCRLQRGIERGFEAAVLESTRSSASPTQAACAGASALGAQQPAAQLRRLQAREGRRRTRCRPRRTRGAPRRTRSAPAPRSHRRCHPTPPAPSPGRGWPPRGPPPGRGGWCARRSSFFQCGQPACRHSPRRSARPYEQARGRTAP